MSHRQFATICFFLPMTKVFCSVACTNSRCEGQILTVEQVIPHYAARSAQQGHGKTDVVDETDIHESVLKSILQE